MSDESVSVLISSEKIQERIAELGKQITAEYSDKKPMIVAVLKGSFMFYSDLIRAIDCDVECDFIGVSSYKGGTRSSGEVQLTLDLNQGVHGKDIILVEDIVDTGLTLNFLRNYLAGKKPNSVKCASLLYKPKAIQESCEVEYVGFEIGNDFVVGYGLDYQEYYRNLPYIGVLSNIN